MTAAHKKQLADIVSPPPRLKPSQWAERFAYIPPEGNAEPGKYRGARMPHQPAMLDDLHDTTVRETYWMMASQAAGKTLCFILDCAYIIAVLKQSIIMVRATKETATEWMRDKFLPTIRATPCMDGLMLDPRKRDSESTSLNRKFPGGSLRVIGAKSPAAFRGSSAPHIRQDEIDSYVATKEGDPMALADRAAITFTNATKAKASTPTLMGFSKVHEGFLSGDQQRYFLPCPCCGHMQWLKTEQLKFSFTEEEHKFLTAKDAEKEKANARTWEIGDLPIRDTKRAMYVCEACNRGWTDAQRIASYMSGHPSNPEIQPRMDPNGRELREDKDGMAAGVIYRTTCLRAEWRATAPFAGIRSRHLSGMYLSIGLKAGFDNYLHQFAEDFLSAKHGGRESLMAWTNMFKCEPFEDAAQKVEWKEVKERAEDYQVHQTAGGDLELELPMGAVFPCFGVDVQIEPPRVEIASYAWGEGQEVWAMDYKVIHGDFDMPEMQARVESYLLNKRFHHPFLGEIGYEAGTFDSGKQTKVYAVYRLCAAHRLNNWYACKGYDQALGSVYRVKKEKRFGGTILDLNTDYLKTQLYDRLRNTEPGPRYIHFPKETIETQLNGKPAILTTPFNDRFYRMLCSEKRMFKGKAWHWVKPTSSTRNEGLDNTVYAFGVYELAKQDSKIARLTEEARKLSGVKDYILKPAAKMPELKQVTQPARAPAKPLIKKASYGGRGGFFNPLGL